MINIITTEALQKLNTKMFADGISYKDSFLRKEPNTAQIDNPDFDDQIPADPDTNPRQIPKFTNEEHFQNEVYEMVMRKINQGHDSIHDDGLERADFE